MQLLKYFALVKVDESTHTISGTATAEVPDKDGEICDYAAAKKDYQRWANEAAESTKAAGQEVSYGNIRLQHNVSDIAGKVSLPVIFDDENKSIHLVTEPENESIFTKARKGFIRGFSQGGDYAWRKCNECKTDIPEGRVCPKCKTTVLVRYAPILSEVSYVDNPCVKAATFDLVKADGTIETKPFSDNEAALISEPNIQKRSSAMEPTQAGAPAIDISAIAEQVSKSVLERLGKSKKYLVTDKDGKKHLPYTDDDGTPNHRLMGAAWAALHDGYRGNKYEGPDKDKAIERLKGIYEKEGMDTPDEKAKKVVRAIVEKRAEKSGLAKSLWDVSRFADLMQSLSYLYQSALYERDQEGDDSPVPAELLTHLESLADVFIAMAEEEVTELTAIAGGKGHKKMLENSALAKAAKPLAEHIEKAKDAVTEHCEKAKAHHTEHCEKMHKLHEAHKAAMHDCLDKMAKIVGSKEEPKKDDTSGQPEKIDPAKEGTANQLKAAGETFTKAQVEELLTKAVNETVQELVKAMVSDEDDDEEAKKRKKKEEEEKASKKAAGIGDRGQMPVIAGNAGPVVKVFPVSKSDDTAQQPAAAAAEVTQAELAKALTGDPAAALKFMKGVRTESGVPATVAGALSTIRK